MRECAQVVLIKEYDVGVPVFGECWQIEESEEEVHINTKCSRELVFVENRKHEARGVSYEPEVNNINNNTCCEHSTPPDVDRYGSVNFGLSKSVRSKIWKTCDMMLRTRLMRLICQYRPGFGFCASTIASRAALVLDGTFPTTITSNYL